MPPVTALLWHTDSHLTAQSSSVDCSRPRSPTVQLPYASRDARSSKRFCSLRYCWRARSFWPSFSIFRRELSLLWNTLTLAACCWFCCLFCSWASCSSTSCCDCLLLLRNSYIKILKLHSQPSSQILPSLFISVAPSKKRTWTWLFRSATVNSSLISSF